MRPSNIFLICIFLVGSVFCNSACSIKSSRETPMVKVVREYAPTVVYIRTETIVDLRESPEWGLYGEQLDLLSKQYFGEACSEGTLQYK